MPILGRGSSVRAGTVQTWASANIPAGWLKCNGAAISRTLYAALFNEIGTTYGIGDGNSTFNLPDMRGEFLRGLDDGRGVDSGRTLGSAQTDDFKSHTHTISNIGYGPFTDGQFDARSQVAYGGEMNLGTPTSNASGGTETRPRNRAMHFIIKY